MSNLLIQTMLGASLGGFLALDTVALGQFFLSSPLVCCSLLGWALGNPLLGVLMGTVLTLPWLGTLPVGGYTPPDSPTAALTVTLGAILARNAYPQLPPEAIAALVLLLAPLWATIAGCGDNLIYHLNEATTTKQETRFIKGDNCGPTRAVLVGLFRFFVKAVVIITAGAWISYGFVALINLLYSNIFNYLGWLYYGWLGLGLGVVLASFRGWRVPAATAAGLAGGLFWALLSGRILW